MPTHCKTNSTSNLNKYLDLLGGEGGRSQTSGSIEGRSYATYYTLLEKPENNMQENPKYHL